MVNGVTVVAYIFFVAANRSTKITPLVLQISAIALVYCSSFWLFAAPSGRCGLFKFSCAIGEKNTIRGADDPSYF